MFVGSAIDAVDSRGERTVVMRLAGVDLTLLVAFDALMSERSVSRAAERMSVGQSAMSATLARLRRLFDDPLLARQGRHLTPTPLALSLVDPVHEVLSTIEQTLCGVRSGFDPATDHRIFTIATSDYVALVFLRPLLGRLAHEAPNIRLHLRPMAPDFRNQLSRNLADLLILPRDLLGPEHQLSVSPLFDDRYVCVVDRDNPDVGDTLTVEQFSSQPYLAYTVGSLASLAEQQLDAAGIPRNLEVTTESLVLAAHLLRGTRLLTLLHERLVRVMRHHLDLRLLEPAIPMDPGTELMVWTPRHEHDSAHASSWPTRPPRTRGAGCRRSPRRSWRRRSARTSARRIGWSPRRHRGWSSVGSAGSCWSAPCTRTGPPLPA